MGPLGLTQLLVAIDIQQSLWAISILNNRVATQACSFGN